MSFFARPTVVGAILFGCFAVIIPRIFLPFFRPKPSHHVDDRFRRPPPPMSRSDPDDIIDPLVGSPQHMHGAHPNMQMNQPGVNSREPALIDQNVSKSAVTFALPMYTVGIAVFFIYTCFKYWKKRNADEAALNLGYSAGNINWNSDKSKFKYQTANRHYEEDDDDENLYAGLDADYVEYLKLKTTKEFEDKQSITTEQRQMHHTLDDMKSSLSFISSKLGASKTANNLSPNEITQLQDRLASTEAQMYKILSALDAASSKMNEITKTTRESLEQPHQAFNREQEYHLSSRSQSESDGSLNDEENSNSDDNSLPQEEQASSNKQREEEEEEDESSSSYEEDDEVPHEMDDDDDDDEEEESESESDRYGLMNTNYECDPTTVDDYEIDTINRPSETNDTQSKVQEWRDRNHSQSLSSSNASIDQDQALPKEEEQNPKQPD